MMTGTDDSNWRTQGFRQSMVAKIEEAVMQCGAPTSKTPMEMETQVFSKAKSKDEYLGFVARLIIHIKEMGSKKMGGGPGLPNQQNPPQSNQVNMGQMGGVQQNLNMMSSMNQMGQMNMMNQQGMVQMNPGMAAALAQQQSQQMNPQGGPQNPILNQQNFMQQAQQMQQMQNSQLQSNQIQNPQMSSVQMQNQQIAQLQNSQLQNQQLQNAQLQNQQLHSQQMQNAQQQMQNQQLQNMQMQNAQLQEHIRSNQMGSVQLGNVQLQGGQLNNVQMQGSQISNVTLGNQIGNPSQMNPQMGNAQVGNPQLAGTTMVNETPMRGVQMQGGQTMQHAQLGGQMGNPNMHNMMNAQQQQSQQMMGARGMGTRLMGPGQANMANQLSALAKQQQTQRGMHRPQSVDGVNVIGQYNSPQQAMMSRGIAPSQFIPPQSGQVPMVQTPSPGPPNSTQTQYLNSPAQSTLMPSPATPGMPQNLRPYQNSLGVPSPGPSLNTPLMAQPTPSPRNADDQACIEKIKELRKYIDLLQRMIAKIGNDEKEIEKSSKMKKLLEILTNPSQRVSMEILLKCEAALKKMEKQNDPGGMLGPTQHHTPTKDQSTVSPFQQVMDSLNNALRTPSSSHTLLRTFRPTVEALTGLSFASAFQEYEDEESTSDNELVDTDIPSMLKRELRTLDSRFHISVVRRGGGMSRLSCCLNDPRLPCVPPLKINVRSDYPYEPPVVVDLMKDYCSTSFLSTVARAFKSRLLHLTRNHAVIELLYMWEMCVRQASNPNISSEYTAIPRPVVVLGL